MDNLNILGTYGAMVDNQSTLSANAWNTLMSTLQTKINELVAASNTTLSVTAQDNSLFYVNGVITKPVNGVITLQAGSEYELQGKLDGSIIVDCGSIAPSENTNLVLKGVTISTNATSAIKYKTPTDNEGFKDLIITLDKDSINYLLCNTVAAKADDQEACIYSMNNLMLRGVGYLTLSNKGGHGVRGTEVILAGPHIYVDANHDAIHAGKLMHIECGTFMTNKCNDVFGTGTEGNIFFYNGEIYAHGVEGNIFDAKVHLYNMNEDGTLKDHVKSSNLKYSVYSANEIIEYAQYFETGSIKQGDTDDSTSAVDLVKDSVSGTYQPTKPYVFVSGKIDAPIVFTTANIDTFMEAGTANPDAEVILSNALIENKSIKAPAIQYLANTAEKGKIKIKAEKDTINLIYNFMNDEDGLTDLDAIKSENNCSLEFKNGSHLVIYSKYGDGIDSGDMKITDSKGSLIVNNCGERGLKGSAIVIGPSCEISSSVVTSYYTDTTDTENYTTMDGNVIVINNVVNKTVGVADTSTEEKAKASGYTDIYARNGKCTKGVFGTTNNELKGIIICGSFAAHIQAELSNSNNIYYNNKVSHIANYLNDCGITNEQYIAIPYGKAPIKK